MNLIDILAHFLDDMYSNSFASYIKAPTSITPRPKLLIDNVFYNNFNESIISGYRISDISDYLAQFIITTKNLQQKTKKKNHKQCFKNFNENLFETISKL